MHRKNKIKILVLSASSVIILVGITLLPYLVNYYFSPDKLIRNTREALEKLLGADVRISGVSLSISKGVTFSGVKVSVPRDKFRNAKDFAEKDAMLIEAESIFVKLRRKGLFGLKLRMGNITIFKPTLNMVRSVKTRKWNYQMLSNGGTEKNMPFRRKTFGVGPRITIAKGEIIFSELNGTRRKVYTRIKFNASAEPHKYFYRIYLKSTAMGKSGPTGFIDFNPRTSEILAGRMERVDISHFQKLLPDLYRSPLRKFGLSGQVAVPQIQYTHKGISQTVIVLSSVKMQIPYSRQQGVVKNPPVLLRFTGMNGKVIFTPAGIFFDGVTGRMNGSPCRLDGEYHPGSDNSSFRINIACQDFVFPDYRDAEEQKIIETHFPWKLRCFLHDFKPVGRCNFDLTITKPAGKNSKITLSGKIVPKFASMEYFKFPYRVGNLDGIIHVQNNSFRWSKLRGTSNGSTIQSSGYVSGPSKYSKVDLRFVTADTPLDDKLFDALPERYKKIWTMFNPSGRGDTVVKLDQAAGKGKEWRRKITVNLRDSIGCFQRFPYKLSDLRGTIKISGNRLELIDMNGKNGGASVKISGSVEEINLPQPKVNLTVSASGVNINTELLAALPKEAADVIRDCNLKGNIDLAGVIHAGENKPIDYKFTCKLKGANITYRDFPYPINDMTGNLTVFPKRVIINGAFARDGPQSIHAKGTIRFGQKGKNISLTVDADNLPVDSKLYQALNTQQKEVWNLIRPGGNVNVHANLVRSGGKPWLWNLKVKLNKCAIRYKDSSQISNLSGDAEFLPGKIDFNDIQGTVGKDGKFFLDGKVALGDNAYNAELKVKFDKMKISHKLLSEPSGSRFFSQLQWKPGGRVSCDLNRVNISSAQQGKQKWNLQGRISVKNGVVQAFDDKPVDVDFSGKMAFSIPDSKFGITGAMKLSSFSWSKRRVTDLRAKLSKNISYPTLKISQISGNFAGGEISGLTKLRFGETKTEYGVQLTINKVNAIDAFNLRAGTSQKIRGKVDGQLFLVGNFGDKYFKRGGGKFKITSAEIFKVPIMKKVYNVIKEKPKITSFYDITVDFSVVGYRAKLTGIRMVGPIVTMIGYGDWNLSNDRIKFYLISAPPRGLRELPILEELLRGASQELTEIEINGTINSPEIQARPLKQLSETIKMMLGG